MSKTRNPWIAYALLLTLAFAFRFSIARFLPNDDPFDGKVYAQMARNLLEQHVFSHATEAPFDPSLIRLPGYPFFLAAIYSVAGHSNNTAVRIAQAVIDTASCALVALLAFYWEPDQQRKRLAAVSALALAALCPFSAIYVATILTETATIFLALTTCVLATLAFRSQRSGGSLGLWALTGLIAGTNVFFRPDSGLFAGAIGLTLVGSVLLRSQPGVTIKFRELMRRALQVVTPASAFTLAFCLLLVPWTIRNWRLFHVFQPLAPAHAEMPGEFVPRGYLAWLRTWIDDDRYVGPVLWRLDESPIHIDDFPDQAFDSKQELDRVAALIDKYNHADSDTSTAGAAVPDTPLPQKQTQPTPIPKSSAGQKSQTNEAEDEGESDEADETESDQSDAGDSVEMTPEIDAAFAQLARERISHSSFRYYFQLPMRRAASLWFDTHSQYYPFEGELLPLDDLDHTTHQHLWLPLFATLTWIYTLLGVAGAWLLWRSRDFVGRRWVVLAALLILPRIAFFSTLENPEPRYVVEVFPFLAVLGGIAITEIRGLLVHQEEAPASSESDAEIPTGN